MGALGSLVRSAPAAVFGATAARTSVLRDADRAVRAPLALSRRVGFVQLTGGVGASTTAALVANLVAHRRSGPVLGVDAAAGGRSMLWHAGLPDTAAQGTDPRRLDPVSTADATAGLVRAGSGLYALDVRPTPVDDEQGAPPRQATESAWADAVAPVTRFFDVVCTDWGVRPPGVDLTAVAYASHAVCLVARSERVSLERAVAVVEAVRSLEHAPVVVVAAVDLGGGGSQAVDAVRWPPGTVFAVPTDRARRSDVPRSSRDLTVATRTAHVRLAAALLTPGRTAR
ncbi:MULTISPECIES: hypothetical protein [unclassified Curtobacterium]|uniref:hypothetical protein n=1 Tax=unclassified Curtobacterium TaxID=257496 RepID=UPI000824B07C|nr:MULTISPECIES: hypothetical protein [unclassified Curtobacterium]WIA95345.1 hypothetical protein QOL16_09320 [Curtobacterium sp. MCBA15_004]WIA98712.1 hypothetical protein QOL15_09055 [Curtobacterium sp. MCBA15_012]